MLRFFAMLALASLACLAAPAGVAADADDARALVRGSLDPAIIRRVIRRAAGERLSDCYRDRLDARPGLRGRWVPRFVIGGDGRIASIATLRSEIADAALERCAIDALRRVRFPRAPGSVIVTWPFDFAPERPRPRGGVPRIDPDHRRPYVVYP